MENGGGNQSEAISVNQGINFIKAFALTVSSQKYEMDLFQEKNQFLNFNVVAELRKAQIQKSHFLAPAVSGF